MTLSAHTRTVRAALRPSVDGMRAETNKRLGQEAGFELLIDEVVPMLEPGVETSFLWVLLRRPA
jgi:hypothetical protein